MTKQAILALADGSIFRGEAIGADGQTVGEVVFNTAMTGYQEILTDPSYAQQIVTLTYPHVGNTGTTPEDAESDRVWSAGLVIRDLPLVASNWRNTMSLADYLNAHVFAGAGLETVEPDPADVASAREMVDAFEREVGAGRAAFAWKGRMVDLPVVDRARRLLARHAAIEGKRRGA